MLRVDAYPTHEYKGFKLRSGYITPRGATLVSGGINFNVASNNATEAKLILFRKGEQDPFIVIPFFDEFKIGNIFTMIVYDLDPEEIEYGFVVNGPNNHTAGHVFNSEKFLIDPYARSLSGRDVWRQGERYKENPFRSRVILSDFDWEGDKPLKTPFSDLIIYEAHVRGFTAHESSNVQHAGTFAGLREKIPYLKELGVNCVELLPIFEFDEFENKNVNPKTNEELVNFWGYSTVSFFAPKAGYAATGKHGLQVEELKTTIKELHKNGIEVILDIVLNHTGEHGKDGPYINFKGIDNKTYYMLTPNGEYFNFSGCGNTLNCNNPVVRDYILTCLRYWASEFHVDGFRFDLASILGRDQKGEPLDNPPILEALAFDPVLGDCKLIAEAWDAGGLYQVGSFPNWGRWAEWNGRYRDDVRRFLRGDHGVTYNVAKSLEGSPHIYDRVSRGNYASINFITAHDGFTLRDLFTYNQKDNLENGENNRDGNNNNNSWDCIIDGNTSEQTSALRLKMAKNALSILLLSHGVPMILSGDEFGNTQRGNNNVYCQDNELGWLNWNDLENNRELFEYVKKLIQLRKNHKCLRSPLEYIVENDMNYPPVSHHGVKAWNPDFDGRMLGTLFSGRKDFVYLGMNMHYDAGDFELPNLPQGFKWQMHLTSDENAYYNKRNNHVTVPGRSTVILTSVECDSTDSALIPL